MFTQRSCKVESVDIEKVQAEIEGVETEKLQEEEEVQCSDFEHQQDIDIIYVIEEVDSDTQCVHIIEY